LSPFASASLPDEAELLLMATAARERAEHEVYLLKQELRVWWHRSAHMRTFIVLRTNFHFIPKFIISFMIVL
jgi:hypothetical protein